MKKRKSIPECANDESNTVYINPYVTAEDNVLELIIKSAEPDYDYYRKYKGFFYSLCTYLFEGQATLTYIFYKTDIHEEKHLFRNPKAEIKYYGYPLLIIDSLTQKSYGCKYISTIKDNGFRSYADQKWLLIYCPDTSSEYIRDTFLDNDNSDKGAHLGFYMGNVSSDLDDDEIKKLMSNLPDKHDLEFSLSPYSSKCSVTFNCEQHSKEIIYEKIKKAAEENGLVVEENT